MPDPTPDPPSCPTPYVAALTVTTPLAAGTYPCGPGTVTLSVAYPPGAYSLIDLGAAPPQQKGSP